MNNICPVCSKANNSAKCQNCSFKKSDTNLSLEDIYHNQVLLTQKLLKIQQQLNRSVKNKENRIITILAGIVKPLKIKVKKIGLHNPINRINSFFQNYLKKDNASITEKLTKTTALRLEGQKKILKSVSFSKLDEVLTNISAQKLMESQRILFHELVEEEKEKIKEELEKQIEKIQQHKHHIHSKNFKP